MLLSRYKFNKVVLCGYIQFTIFLPRHLYWQQLPLQRKLVSFSYSDHTLKKENHVYLRFNKSTLTGVVIVVTVADQMSGYNLSKGLNYFTLFPCTQLTIHTNILVLYEQFENGVIGVTFVLIKMLTLLSSFKLYWTSSSILNLFTLSFWKIYILIMYFREQQQK